MTGEHPIIPAALLTGPGGGMPPDYGQPGITPAQIGAIVWAWRRHSLLIAAAVLLLGTIGAALWPRTYEATATLMIDYEVNDPLSEREFPTGLLGSYMATQLDLARGMEVMRAVVDRLRLTHDADFVSGYSGDGAGLRDYVALRLQKNLTVEQGRFGSQLVHVTYADADAATAARIANAVAEVYAEQTHERLLGPANQRAKRYNEQLEELKDKVTRAQEQFTQYRQQSGLIDSESKYDVDLLSLSTLESRLLEAQNARRAAEARAASNQSVGSQVLGSNTVQGLKGQLAVLRARQAELSASLGPNHPQMIELAAQIKATERSLGSELGVYTSNANEELKAARQLEAKLETAVAERRVQVLKIREIQDQGQKFALELASAQAVYKKALDGHDQVMFASTGSYRNVDLVSRATPPPRPTRPKTVVAMLMVAVMALGLGLALPFCWELLDRRVRCRDDLERDLGIPVLIELGRTPGTALVLARGAT